MKRCVDIKITLLGRARSSSLHPQAIGLANILKVLPRIAVTE